MLPDGKLAEIKARADAATEGPWWAWDRGTGWHIALSGPDDVDEYHRPDRLLPEGDRTDIGRREDAEFIAAARTDVPILLAEIERLQEELDGERNDATLLRIRHLEPAWEEIKRLKAGLEYHQCRICGQQGPVKHEGSSYVCAACAEVAAAAGSGFTDAVPVEPEPHQCPSCNEVTTYQSYSGGREFYCPGCGNKGMYEDGDFRPPRVQMLADGRYDELRAEMREEIARRRAGVTDKEATGG